MNHVSTVLIIILILLLLLGGIIWAQKPKPVLLPGDHNDSIIYQGIRRHFLIHIPENRAQEKRLPLIFVLHGGGGTSRAVANLTGFSQLADSAGFIVVYPQALNRHWNDGRAVKRFRSHRQGVDDVGFISCLIDTMIDRVAIDPQRIYATGISNGGMMCLRLGCELSQRLAAIASVAAALPENLAQKSKPLAPISVLMINGTKDPIVPYQGGGVGLLTKRGRVISVEKTVDFWVRNNGCPEKPAETKTNYDESSRMKIKVYSGGRDSTEVILYTIEGGGHIWPGGEQRDSRFGRYSQDINATKVIWQFFERQRRL
ncbi:MAG: extracellular catalytic domain type 1 short-chain-length polyhydroxyalkanoate depolymerase [bacterium]